MPESLIACSGTANTTNSTATYNPWAGSLTATTTENTVQVKCFIAGTASLLTVRNTSNTTTVASTVKTRVGAANGGQTATLTAGTPGIYQDALNTDSVAVNDLRDYQTAPGSANVINLTSITVMFVESTTLTCSKLGVEASVAVSVSAKNFWPLSGQLAASSTTETNMKTRIRKAGTWKNLYIRVNVATGNSAPAANAQLNDNGVAGALTATCTLNTSGIFADTTNTQSGTAGHDYDYVANPNGTTSTFTILYVGVEYETTTGDSVCVAGVSAGVNFTKSSTNYIPPGGGFAATTTQANAQVYYDSANFTVSNLGMIASVVSAASGNSVTLMQNTTATALTVSPTAAGLIEDTIDTVTGFATTDLLSTRVITGATTGGMTIVWVTLHFNAPNAVSVPLYLQPTTFQWVEV